MQAKAIHAYEKGATGKGVIAAVIDTGIVATSPEFAGRIHAASTDVAGSRGLSDDAGHGTAVASVLGAAKNGVGMHGVAFDATLLVLRADTPGTCPTSCSNLPANVAKAINLAVENKARVINMSFGQKSFPWAPVIVEAIDKATAAGVVVVMTAGNENEDNPIVSSSIAAQSAARNSIIIAGGANKTGTGISTFSNRAGDLANFYLAALGDGVGSLNKDGTVFYPGGTSLSAPVIAGAVALLAQAFPNLTGQQIVNLLFTTATDIGSPGTDPVAGRGLLNLANAFAPQGGMSLAGSKAPLSLASNGVLSPAMGDATGNLKGTVFLDSYGRAYETDLSRTLSRTAQDLPLHAALDGSYRTNSAALGPLAVSISTTRDLRRSFGASLQQLELSAEEASRAKAIAGTVIGRLSPKTAVAFGFSEGGKDLQKQLSGQQTNAFLVARDRVAGNSLQMRTGFSIGIRHDFGPLAFTMISESGEVHDTFSAQSSAPAAFLAPGRSGYRTNAILADRRLGRIRLRIGGLLLDEQATILGGRFSSAFSSAGSSSWFADGVASLALGRGWGAVASYRHGWTSVQGGDALVQGGRLSSNAFALDLTKTGGFGASDKVAFRLMQPLRVRSGGLDINLPVSYDYASGAVSYQQRLFNLAPTGREMDYEVSYATRLLGGSIAANAFIRTDPGHIEWMKKDVGGAIRFTLGF